MNIWAAVDRLVDQATDMAGLETHGLDLWAAHRWYSTSKPIPPQFLLHERAAIMATLSVRSQLAWIRQVLDGPIILLKGPEVAARYPDPALRPFGDLDLLVPNTDDAQQKLIAAGCTEVTDARPHHRPGLQCPGSMLLVEIHERPNAPTWVSIPTAELFASAVPSTLALDGIMTVTPAQHALLLAAHSWHHEPFRRLIDLIDIAAMSEGIAADELEELAEQWGLARVWKITNLAIDAFCTGEPPPGIMCRPLASHLWEARERTLGELVVTKYASNLLAPASPIGVLHTAKNTVLLSLSMMQKLYRVVRQHTFIDLDFWSELESTGENPHRDSDHEDAVNSLPGKSQQSRFSANASEAR